MSKIESSITSSFETLASIVQKVGIPLNSEDHKSRIEALEFIISGNRERYGKASQEKIDKLIQEVGQQAIQDAGKAACEVSWRLHQEVASLMKFRVEQLELSLCNEDSKRGLKAIYDLYLACKSRHYEKYQQGEIVNFAGVPIQDFISAY